MNKSISDEAKSNWRFYRAGVLQPFTEDEIRKVCLSWRYLSDEKGQASVLIEQLWNEIDRLRAENIRLKQEMFMFDNAANLVVQREDKRILDEIQRKFGNESKSP